MPLSCLLIIVGFVLLGKGADLLVTGASSLAKRYGISDLVIGLTIVALGTSAPEAVVSFLSAASGNSGMALGNIIGSNIANLCLVLGIAGVIMPIRIHRGTVWKEIPYCLFTSCLLLVILTLFNDNALVSRIEAAALLLALGVYVSFMFTAASEPPTGEPKQSGRHLWVLCVMIVGGLAGLVFGGDLIVKNAIKVAGRIGLSQELIGITIVALGTSLPEMATAVVAVLKGNVDVAVGNVVGSNILNTCFVLGGAAMIRPIPVGAVFTVDAIVIVLASLLLFVYMFTGRKLKLDKWEAVIFLLMYAAYMGFAVVRG
ncbi:MAG: calcium/sodium antiporter [Kiritimatiellia bacterium]|nr:calcium/sodium antiporter [Kiritimatiellia bacterium]MDP6848182.1 calcium/sodium antiporter [Kiritimatiellia bacterium]